MRLLQGVGEGEEITAAFPRQLAHRLLPSLRRGAVPGCLRTEPGLADRCHGTAKPLGQFGVRHGAKQEVGSGSEIHRYLYAAALTAKVYAPKFTCGPYAGQAFGVSTGESMAKIRTVNPELAAEMRGFFFGEGHIDLVRQGKTTRAVSPRVRIGLREDDKAILEVFRDSFGGSLVYRASTQSWCWQLTGRERVSMFAEMLVQGLLPTKKRREVALLLEACSLIPMRGTHHTDASARRLTEIRDEMKASRKLEVVGG